ncbi:hypothetical protein [Spiroplasma endosymbiont of Glossina fuscipes fuscipes]
MKKILSLVSVLTIAGAPMLTLNVMSLYDVKNNLEITNFKTNKQEKN